jgi:hypothetical protein
VQVRRLLFQGGRGLTGLVPQPIQVFTFELAFVFTVLYVAAATADAMKAKTNAFTAQFGSSGTNGIAVAVGDGVGSVVLVGSGEGEAVGSGVGDAVGSGVGVAVGSGLGVAS